MTSIQFGQIIEIRPEQFDRYKSHHVTDWPDVLATIKACNIQYIKKTGFCLLVSNTQEMTLKPIY